jgi:hypothetical protein
MAKVRASPEATNRAITVDGRLVGSIASFVIEGDTEVTYGSTDPSGGRASPVERSPCSWS